MVGWGNASAPPWHAPRESQTLESAASPCTGESARRRDGTFQMIKTCATPHALDGYRLVRYFAPMAEICGPIVRLGKICGSSIAHRSPELLCASHAVQVALRRRFCDPPSRPWCVVELGSATCTCARGLPLLPIKIKTSLHQLKLVPYFEKVFSLLARVEIYFLAGHHS